MTTISHPCSITPRLLPGVYVADAWVSVEPTGSHGLHGKPEWRWFIDHEDFADSGSELWAFGGHREALECLLCFLGEWSDPGSWLHDDNINPDPVSPFSDKTLRWAGDAPENEEIAMMEMELSGDTLG